MKNHWMIPILILLLVTSSCGNHGPELATNPDQIIGIYTVNPGNTVISFTAEGTHIAAPSLTLVKNPVYSPATYWFEGEQLYIETDDDPVCGTKVTAIYTVQLLEDGKLKFSAVEDSCEHRVNIFQGIIEEETGEPHNIWSPVE